MLGNKFAIIGTGIVGTAMAILLERAGYDCVGVHTRSQRSYETFGHYLSKNQLELDQLVQEADFIWITTQDTQIQTVAEELSRCAGKKEKQYWIHCSGSLPSAVMNYQPLFPVHYLSLHPLQAFASIDHVLDLIPGTHFGLEGSSLEAEQWGEELIRQFGGIPHKINPAKKGLYHAGAVVASNYLVALASLAVKLFQQAGIEQEEALASLLPLMAGSCHNIEEVGLPGALTGPIERGDTQVIAKHLQEIPSHLKEGYKSLGRLALELGKEKKQQKGESYPPEALQELLRLLE